MTNGFRVFVYGSLRPGTLHHRQFCEGKIDRAIAAFMRGNLYHLARGYPALTDGDDWAVSYTHLRAHET